jgi:predicted DNA repair protein MutK
VFAILDDVAMLLVGGGMFVHNVEAVHHLLSFIPALAAELAAGLLVGGALLGGMRLWKKAVRRSP